MIKKNTGRDRLSIDVRSEVHRQIKAYAAFHGQTIREYVIESIKERLRAEKESRELNDLSFHLDEDHVLKELWDNKKDAGYDKSKISKRPKRTSKDP